jgi:hypothetical protein
MLIVHQGLRQLSQFSIFTGLLVMKAFETLLGRSFNQSTNTRAQLSGAQL